MGSTRPEVGMAVVVCKKKITTVESINFIKLKFEVFS